MKRYVHPPSEQWAELLSRPVIDFQEIEALVAPVLEKVRREGDSALKEYTSKFDGVNLDSFAVTQEEIDLAVAQTDEDLKKSIEIAAKNIETFHSSQRMIPEKVETSQGVICWRESRAIEKVGLYIPGGTAPLFSTLLMLGIPAKIAGCKEIVLCTPPSKDGSVHPAILFAANLVGVSKIFKCGGAQAVAAMAYGTESIPQVYKIFGPGNQYVTAAKQLISKEGIAIDMPAGPSEVAVIADESAVPSFVASDLISQAEHGSDSQSILITTSEELADQVEIELQEQLIVLPRADFATKSLANSATFIVKNTDQVIDMVNYYAPEHLIVSMNNYDSLIPRIENAGSVFLGNYTPESAGDYASGTNHTLPTNGFAKAWSGVSLDSFTKKITFQEITKEGIEGIGPAIESMASAEELEGHRKAVELRRKH